MNWEDRILRHEGAPLYLGEQSEGVPGAVTRGIGLLRQQQLETWPALQQGIAALESVEYRSLLLEGTEIVLQHNPNRIVSSSAKVDARSIAGRPCFLCTENMPVEERGIRFGDRLVLTFNPAPILDWHIVAIDIEHTPQRICGRMGSFLDLSAQLGPEFVVIYNGPECGASAPDHLHFQAARSSQLLPAFVSIEHSRDDFAASTGGTIISNPTSYPIRYLSLNGSNVGDVLDTLSSVVKVLDELQAGKRVEPMINIVARYSDSSYQVLLFPRSKHRPESYFLDNESKRTISPAALDLAGIVVTPEERDFCQLESIELMSILREVTLNETEFSHLRDSLAKEIA